MKLRHQWLLVVAALLLPYLALMAAGWTWLYERGWLWHWVFAAVLLTLTTWPAIAWLRRKTRIEMLAKARPGEIWPDVGEQAWADVLAVSRRNFDDLPLDRPEALWGLLEEVLGMVARRFHPESERPLLEVPVPHLLKVAELVSRDLGEAVSESLPGSHVMTINDLTRLGRWASFTHRLYHFYRLVSFGLNPTTSVMKEMQRAATSRLMDSSGREIRRWSIEFCVQRAGYYAIQLYSGNLAVDERLLRQPTSRSREDLTEAQRRDEEPLRILLLGKVKAGKSSLLNALFGEERAAVDVVPLTQTVDPHHRLADGGLPQALIYDTPGYEDATQGTTMAKSTASKALDSDLILLVVSATDAARGADRTQLHAIREEYARHPSRALPPILIALSHIDHLRPLREWNPPYDLASDAPKARNIVEAVKAVADDLGVEVARVIPVCLAAERQYNVQEALIPTILSQLPAANRARYLRSLKERRDEQFWKDLWTQAQNGGRMLMQTGLGFAERAMREIDRRTRPP